MIVILQYMPRKDITKKEIRDGRKRKHVTLKGDAYMSQRTQLIQKGYEEVGGYTRNKWRFQTSDEKPFKTRLTTRNIAGLQGTYNKRRRRWEFVYPVGYEDLIFVVRNIQFLNQWQAHVNTEMISKGDTLVEAVTNAKLVLSARYETSTEYDLVLHLQR